MSIDSYLDKFGDISKLDRYALLEEMDAVWDRLELDGRRPLSSQREKVSEFYNHPVWVLNGKFSEFDPVSRSHRLSIVRYVASLGVVKVADYGGGSGVLAKFLSEGLPRVEIDIVEPYPADYFVRSLADMPRIKYVPRLRAPYDLVIAQDVLEHVDDPAGLSLAIVESVRMNGYVIFANCFYPEIKCHLPATFYLRHQFRWLMRRAGLRFMGNIPGAMHAHAFQRVGKIDSPRFWRANRRARLSGPVVNAFYGLASKVRRVVMRGIRA